MQLYLLHKWVGLLLGGEVNPIPIKGIISPGLHGVMQLSRGVIRAEQNLFQGCGLKIPLLWGGFLGPWPTVWQPSVLVVLAGPCFLGNELSIGSANFGEGDSSEMQLAPIEPPEVLAFKTHIHECLDQKFVILALSLNVWPSVG